MNASASTDPGVRRGGFGAALLKLLVVAILLVAGWTWFTLSWSYSDGDRGGVLQKFSRKGWICKTYEGELAMYVVAGVAPQIWAFSARDPQVAADLARYVGERVQLHYTEHVGIPTNCFGETRYFVDRVILVPTPGAATMPAPAAGATPAAPGSPAAVPAAPPLPGPSAP
jgi:hypothetical protein